MSTRDTAATTRKNPRRGQKRGVFGIIKRELRRRAAIEPVIGHLKTDGHLGCCYLKGRAGDAANVILSAVGHNSRRIPRLAQRTLGHVPAAAMANARLSTQLNPAS